jgi:uncharacterized RDD family membrane protein YckC
MSEILRPRKYARAAQEPLLTTYQRGNPENRFWAKVIDSGLVAVLASVAGWFSSSLEILTPIIAWAYFDRMGRGQSPGKWLLGLHSIENQQGDRISLLQSLIRNLPCVLLNLALIFERSGQFWTLLLAGLWVTLETYFIFSLRSGIRMGDIFANTRVCDYRDEHTQFIERFLKDSNTP